MTADNMYNEISYADTYLVELEDFEVESNVDVDNNIIYKYIEEASEIMHKCMDYLQKIIDEENKLC